MRIEHPRQVALVLIDLQNWTLGMPLAPNSAASVISNANRLARQLKLSKGLVILTRAAFSEGYADMLRQPVDLPLPVPKGGIPEQLLAFSSEIASEEADVVITKRQWSAFYGTELDLQLRRRGVDTIILGGVMTNFGVESTARDAWQLNYSVLVAADAVSSLSAEMHRFSIDSILPRVSRVRSTDAILEALSDSAEGEG
jgi:nicotinamidase-related amidase